VKLTVGTQNYTLSLANNSLIGLRDQINTLGAGVTASILTTANGNYLSLAANASGATTLTLTDDPSGAATTLLTAANQGTDAVFTLNGITVTQTTNQVNSVIPGVTFGLLGPSASPVTLTLATDRSQLSSALNDFVTQYNTLKSAVTAQVGERAGLLTGNPLIAGLQQSLREVTSYRASTGGVRSLTDLGITFDNTGKAQFDTPTFNALSDSSISSAFQFVGTATSGLAGFGTKLTQYSDPITGLIRQEQDGIDRLDQHLQQQIETLTTRATDVQTKLLNRLTQADSLLAQLESQQNFLSASLQSLNLVLYGKSNQ